MKFKKMASVTISLALSLALLTGCTSSNLIAKIDGYKLTKEEFNKEVTLSEYLFVKQQVEGGLLEKDYWEKNKKNILADMKSHLAEQIAIQEILSQEAAKKKIIVDEKDLKENVKLFKDDMKKYTDFSKLMKDNGITDEFLLGSTERYQSADKYLQDYITNMKFSDKDLEKYYEDHKSDYTSEKVKASHILFKTTDDKGNALDAAKVKTIQTKAEDVLKKINAGEDFAKLAKEYSEDPGSKDKGGDVGAFSKEEMVPEFATAAFTLKKGEVSKLVKTMYGYHIIKVTEAKKKETAPYDQIKNDVEQRFKSDAVVKHIEDLKKQYNFKVYIEAPKNEKKELTQG